ncbi:hypothetical protein [Zavarzinella formosa]|uniref:hypothetical protein n=1 Tax=Zavarzinella formosa TaxID=360055 RepID=UPI000302545A|nr:hypothetical protein [Zavarzinella formosa]
MAFTYMQGERGERNGWLFHYVGEELSPRAKVKAMALLDDERSIERALTTCLSGAAYSGREEDISRFRKRLREKGEERERCELLARELARAGERVFSLALGDLVYFGMDEAISDPATVVVSGESSTFQTDDDE